MIILRSGLRRRGAGGDCESEFEMNNNRARLLAALDHALAYVEQTLAEIARQLCYLTY